MLVGKAREHRPLSGLKIETVSQHPSHCAAGQAEPGEEALPALCRRHSSWAKVKTGMAVSEGAESSVQVMQLTAVSPK